MTTNCKRSKNINFDNGNGPNLDAVDIEDAEDILDQMNAYWDTITELMDPEIRKAIHGDLGPCSRADFLAEYLRRAHNDIVIG